MAGERNWKRSFEGIYERERLRRLARKLGLRLIKSDRSRHDASPAAAQPPQDGLSISAGNVTDFRNPVADLDRCG
jgi:hypothetical protein